MNEGLYPVYHFILNLQILTQGDRHTINYGAIGAKPTIGHNITLRVISFKLTEFHQRMDRINEINLS